MEFMILALAGLDWVAAAGGADEPPCGTKIEKEGAIDVILPCLDISQTPLQAL
jgi:hypothetical protein